MANNIFKRVSVRDFRDREVEKEKIILLLKAAMAAPSANNQQPWEFIVSTDRDYIRAASKSSPWAKCVKKAPLLIVLCMRNKGMSAPEFVPQDMGICAENILLEAVDLDLGGVYIGLYPDEELVAKATEIIVPDPSLDVFCMIALGYPKMKRPQKDRYDEARIHWKP